MANIIFEDILPWGTTGGDTGLSARLKLKRNFDKIKSLFAQIAINLGTHTAWGRTFWQNGQPQDVSGDMTDVGSITMSGSLNIGGGTLRWVAADNDGDGYFEFSHTVASLGGVSGLGIAGGGSGGSGGVEYLSSLLDVSVGGASAGQVLTYRNGYWVAETPAAQSLSGYATEAWVMQGWKVKDVEEIMHSEASALITGDMIPYMVTLNDSNGTLEVHYAQLPGMPDVWWEDVLGRPATYTPSTHDHDNRYYISGGTITLGGSSITPLTSHQALEDKTVLGARQLQAVNGTDKIVAVFFPVYTEFNDMGWYSGTSEYDYYRSCLRWLCREYAATYGGDVVFMGMGIPSSVRFMTVMIYNLNDVDGNGLPRHSFGTASSYGNGGPTLMDFGTDEYSFYAHGEHASTADQATYLTGGYRGYYGMDDLLTFTNQTNYVAARFSDDARAAKSVQTYIEWWQQWNGGQNGGWMNHQMGSLVLNTEPDGTGGSLTVHGDVGIGTSAPAAKLHVAGDARVDGNVYLAQGNALYFGTGTNYNTLTYNGNEVAVAYGTRDAVPTKIYGTSVEIMSKLRIGNGTIEWDYTVGMFKLTGGLYSDGAMSALGASGGTSSGLAVDSLTVGGDVSVDGYLVVDSHIFLGGGTAGDDPCIYMDNGHIYARAGGGSTVQLV